MPAWAMAIQVFQYLPTVASPMPAISENAFRLTLPSSSFEELRPPLPTSGSTDRAISIAVYGLAFRYSVPASSASDCQSADNVDTSLTRHQRADQVSRSQHLLDPALHLVLRQLGALRDLGVGCPGREPIADGLEELLDCSLLGVERHPANHSLTRLVRVHTRPGNLSGENESARVRLRVRLRERHHHSGEVVHEPVAYPPLGHPHGVPVVVDRVHVRGLPKLVHVNLDELQAPDLTDVLHLEAGADLGKNPRSSVVHGLSQFSSKLFESGIARPSKLRASARAFACSSLRPCAIRLNPGRSGLVGGIFIHTEYVFMSLLWATKKSPVVYTGPLRTSDSYTSTSTTVSSLRPCGLKVLLTRSRCSRTR